VFDREDVNGVCVGFYIPAYLAGTNVPGYHFHFLSDDKRFGGHVMDFVAESVLVELDEAKGFSVEVIDSAAFESADLVKDRSADTSKVERGK
jgi:acetolactate decarboxylase